jgi:hypothetical protein
MAAVANLTDIAGEGKGGFLTRRPSIHKAVQG